MPFLNKECANIIKHTKSLTSNENKQPDALSNFDKI